MRWRNLQHCPKECRKNAYISLVKSVLEYGATIWDPYQKNDIEKLEKIERRGARFINKDYRSREEGCIDKMLKRTKPYYTYLYHREEGCIDKMLKELNLTKHIYTTEKKDV